MCISTWHGVVHAVGMVASGACVEYGSGVSHESVDEMQAEACRVHGYYIYGWGGSAHWLAAAMLPSGSQLGLGHMYVWLIGQSQQHWAGSGC